MIRVLVLLVALGVWCPPAFAQKLANLHIVVDAEPGTPRTEALVALLRTRFTRVDVGAPATADVVVLDRLEGDGERGIWSRRWVGTGGWEAPASDRPGGCSTRSPTTSASAPSDAVMRAATMGGMLHKSISAKVGIKIRQS